jgi:hypothetical protein
MERSINRDLNKHCIYKGVLIPELYLRFVAILKKSWTASFPNLVKWFRGNRQVYVVKGGKEEMCLAKLTLHWLSISSLQSVGHSCRKKPRVSIDRKPH